MTRTEVFDAWAPPSSVWSRWVKPVLFAHVETAEVDSARVEALLQQSSGVDLSWSSEVDQSSALLVDIPGVEGILLGLALARSRGYRPIPLYNGLPPTVQDERAWVATRPLLSGLVEGAPLLEAAGLPASAPPVFLLDANRAGEPGKFSLSDEHYFDNRSVSFPSDFPSGRFLKSHGIARVILIQAQSKVPQRDLRYTLHLWQTEGVRIEGVSLAEAGSPKELSIRKPSWISWTLLRAAGLLGLVRGGVAGFGAFVSGSAG